MEEDNENDEEQKKDMDKDNEKGHKKQVTYKNPTDSSDLEEDYDNEKDQL